MDRAMCFFGGAAVGAVTMYYLDPDRGRARRAMCEDQMAARGRRAARYLDKAGRDLAHRTTGLAHEAAHLARGETPREDGHRRMSFDLMNEHLAPGTRLLIGVLGGALFTFGLTQRAPEACVLGTIGAALALPAATGGGAASGFGLRLAARQERRPRRLPEATATAERRGQLAPVM
jgi:hypothetical protein